MQEFIGKYTKCKVFNDVIEESAIKQIYEFLNHPAFEDNTIRIMPDVHAGTGAVIGFTSTLGTKIIPNVIGVDIGCGVLCYALGNINIDFDSFDAHLRTNIPSGCTIRSKTPIREIMDKSYKQINRKEMSGEFLNLIKETAKNTKQEEQYIINSLGSLGGGNHFIEIGQDEEENKYLTIHSGSRNFGLKIATYHQKIAKMDNSFGVLSYLENENADLYCKHMEIATYYAKWNREIIANILFGHQLKERYESVHNYIDFQDRIIRKGAISAKKDEKIVIPWNMRDGLILGVGLGNKDWNCSAPHGAGRIMGRKFAKKNLNLEEYKQTMTGIWSSCINEGTLDESPMAYKNSEEIEQSLGPSVKIIKKIKPIYNFKASE